MNVDPDQYVNGNGGRQPENDNRAVYDDSFARAVNSANGFLRSSFSSPRRLPKRNTSSKVIESRNYGTPKWRHSFAKVRHGLNQIENAPDLLLSEEDNTATDNQLFMDGNDSFSDIVASHTVHPQEWLNFQTAGKHGIKENEYATGKESSKTLKEEFQNCQSACIPEKLTAPSLWDSKSELRNVRFCETWDVHKINPFATVEAVVDITVQPSNIPIEKMTNSDIVEEKEVKSKEIVTMRRISQTSTVTTETLSSDLTDKDKSSTLVSSRKRNDIASAKKTKLKTTDSSLRRPNLTGSSRTKSEVLQSTNAHQHVATQDATKATKSRTSTRPDCEAARRKSSLTPVAVTATKQVKTYSANRKKATNVVKSPTKRHHAISLKNTICSEQELELPSFMIMETVLDLSSIGISATRKKNHLPTSRQSGVTEKNSSTLNAISRRTGSARIAAKSNRIESTAILLSATDDDGFTVMTWTREPPRKQHSKSSLEMVASGVSPKKSTIESRSPMKTSRNSFQVRQDVKLVSLQDDDCDNGAISLFDANTYKVMKEVSATKSKSALENLVPVSIDEFQQEDFSVVDFDDPVRLVPSNVAKPKIHPVDSLLKQDDHESFWSPHSFYF